jgi:RHS repeat-associated protein
MNEILKKQFKVLMLGLVLFAGSAFSQEILYVDAASTAVGANGSTWAMAYSNLNSAFVNISLNPRSVMIRIAEGIYKPGTKKTDQFYTLVDGLAQDIQGGYCHADHRLDSKSCPTILSGDLAGDDNYASWPTTIAGANTAVASGMLKDNTPYLLYARGDIRIRSIRFRGVTGKVVAGANSIKLEDVSVEWNAPEVGIEVYGSSKTFLIDRSIFHHNIVRNGTLLVSEHNSQFQVSNSMFFKNIGQLIWLEYNNSTLNAHSVKALSNSFVDNKHPNSPLVSLMGGANFVIANNCFFANNGTGNKLFGLASTGNGGGNQDFTNFLSNALPSTDMGAIVGNGSNVLGEASPGTVALSDLLSNWVISQNNIVAAPVFLNSSIGDYRQDASSNLIDNGDNTKASGTVDLAGNPRLVDGDGNGVASIDIGASEYTRPTPSLIPGLHIKFWDKETYVDNLWVRASIIISNESTTDVNLANAYAKYYFDTQGTTWANPELWWSGNTARALSIEQCGNGKAAVKIGLLDGTVVKAGKTLLQNSYTTDLPDIVFGLRTTGSLDINKTSHYSYLNPNPPSPGLEDTKITLYNSDGQLIYGVEPTNWGTCGTSSTSSSSVASSSSSNPSSSSSAASGIHLRYFDENTNGVEVTPSITISNEGSSSVSLANGYVYYYFATEGLTSWQQRKYTGLSSISMQDCGSGKATVKLSLPSNAVLQAGKTLNGNSLTSMSKDIGFGIFTTDYKALNKSLHYSYLSPNPASPGSENPKITLYNGNGQLLYGVEPISWGTCGVQSSSSSANVAPVISNANSAPTQSLTLNENMTSVVDLDATDADVPSNLVFSIIVGTDAALFSIDASTGVLSFKIAPDFEAPADADHNNSYTVRVQVSDGFLTDFQDQIIQVNNVVEVITGVNLSHSTVNENDPISHQVGTLSTTGGDNGIAYSFSLVSGTGSADNGSFELQGNSLLRKTVFDYEAKSSYSIRVRAEKNGDPTLFLERNFTITVIDLNEAPSDILLSENKIRGTVPAGTLVGIISAADSDPSKTFIYTLVAGQLDNSLFKIVDNALQTAVQIRYDARKDYHIQVMALDRFGLSLVKELAISQTGTWDVLIKEDRGDLGLLSKPTVKIQWFNVSTTPKVWISYYFSLESGNVPVVTHHAGSSDAIISLGSGQYMYKFSIPVSGLTGSSELAFTLENNCNINCEGTCDITNVPWDLSDDYSASNPVSANYSVTEKILVTDANGKVLYGKSGGLAVLTNPEAAELIMDVPQINSQVPNMTVAQSYLSGNAVVNGSFEDRLSNWNSYAGAPLSLDSSMVGGSWDGFFWAKVGAVTGKTGYQGLYYDIQTTDPAFSMLESAAFSFSARVRGTAGKKVYLQVEDLNSRAAQSVTLGEGWVQAKFTWTGIKAHGAGSTQQFCRFAILSLNGESFEVDNVVISPTTEASVNVATRFTSTRHNEIQTNSFDGNSELLVSNKDLDVLGRPWRSWLPAPLAACALSSDCSGFRGDYSSTSAVTTADLASLFYIGTDGGSPDAEGIPYTETTYEEDQTTVVDKVGLPGLPFSLHSPDGSTANTHVAKTYFAGVNSLNLSDLGNKLTQPLNTANPIFAYQLTVDADGRKAITIKDAFGRVRVSAIVTGSQYGNYLFAKTINEYDAIGNLRKIHPPLSCEYQGADPLKCVAPSTYSYDGENRKIQQVEPDAGVTNFFYDLVGRQRATQTQRMINAGIALVSRYDNLDRVMYTAIVEVGVNDLRAKVLDPSWPGVSDAAVLSRNYYDVNPGRQPLGVGGPSLYTDSYLPSNNYSSRLVATVTNEKGISDISDRASDTWHSVFYDYDKYGNVTNTFEYNGLNKQTDGTKLTRIRNEYDNAGRLAKVGKWFFPENLEPGVIEKYQYDSRGRVSIISDNSGNPTAEYSYFPTGQSKEVVIGGRNRPIPLKIRYQWHISGALKKVEAFSGQPETRVYSEELDYEKCGTNADCTPQFAGNIAKLAQQIRMGNGSESGSQVFTYDLVNRLVKVLNESRPEYKLAMKYDDQGRIASQRRGAYAIQSNGGEYHYEVGTNRLLWVNTGMAPQENVNGLDLPGGLNLPDRDMSGNANDPSSRLYEEANFQYDADGNMTADLSKVMTLSWNYLGLPDMMAWTEGADEWRQFNRYDASGRRITKIETHRPAGTTEAWQIATARHYSAFGQEVLEGTSSEIYLDLPMGLGRYTNNSSWELEANIKNHLGSTMIVHSSNGGNKGQFDYTAFGNKVTLSSTTEEITKEFTGKELDKRTRLNYFGARYYDADIGMWISPDPKRQFASPYLYAGNGFNPVNGVDADGKVYDRIFSIAVQFANFAMYARPVIQENAVRIGIEIGVIEGVVKEMGASVPTDASKVAGKVSDVSVDGFGADLTGQPGYTDIGLGLFDLGSMVYRETMKSIASKVNGEMIFPIQDSIPMNVNAEPNAAISDKTATPTGSLPADLMILSTEDNE